VPDQAFTLQLGEILLPAPPLFGLGLPPHRQAIGLSEKERVMAGLNTLSAEELAAYLGVSHQRVYQLLSEGKVPPPINTQGPGFQWGRAQIERWADQEWWGTHPARQPPH
jgi:excisionase family DNA binding protein